LKRLLSVLLLAAAQVAKPAAAPPAAGPDFQFDTEGRLLTPASYREWPLVGTGLGMAYGPLRQTPNGTPPFTNVFVNPASYRAFMQTGSWPDRTLFILEVRASLQVNNAASGANGWFQGEITGIEAELKDATRFPGKWGFFNLGKSSAGALIPTTASCYSCHATNAAVENTFVQFYPALREVARANGTLRQAPEQF
jgi:hypothetical protein